jgi:hypothetical protein
MGLIDRSQIDLKYGLQNREDADRNSLKYTQIDLKGEFKSIQKVDCIKTISD